MNGQEGNLREQIIAEYRDDLEKLLRYLPFLEQKGSSDAQQFYEGDGENKVIPVPVYDTTLLAFVKEARNTKFMNRNYPYAYRKWRMPNAKAERIAMESATLRDIDLFRGILSRYVTGLRYHLVLTGSAFISKRSNSYFIVTSALHFPLQTTPQYFNIFSLIKK